MSKPIQWKNVDFVPGFGYYDNAFNCEQANELVRHIEEEGRWTQDYERRAQYHGYVYHHRTRSLSRVGPLADWILDWAHFVHERGWMSELAQQATVHEYQPGTGIGDHCDDRRCFPGNIVTLSLVSICTYRLVHRPTCRLRTLVIRPRSAVVLQGEARDVWKHGIPHFRLDAGVEDHQRRLSITFRTINPARVKT